MAGEARRKGTKDERIQEAKRRQSLFRAMKADEIAAAKTAISTKTMRPNKHPAAADARYILRD